MESRLEWNKKLRKLKRIKKLKRFCIFILLILLALGVEIVNQSFIELSSLDNQNLIKFDIKTKELSILGKTYIIDLSFIKKIIKRPVPWSFYNP